MCNSSYVIYNLCYLYLNYVFVCRCTYVQFGLCVCVCLSVYLSICLCVCLSVCVCACVCACACVWRRVLWPVVVLGPFVYNWGGGTCCLPITVAAWSKAWTVLACSNTGIMGLNPTWDMDVCLHLFCVCAVLCVQVAALQWADPPSKESCQLRKRSRNWKVAKAQQRVVEP
jgi:hypothetical protein